MSKKVLLTVHPVVYARLQERMKAGYGSVQEVINEILRKEMSKVKRSPKKGGAEDYLRR